MNTGDLLFRSFHFSDQCYMTSGIYILVYILLKLIPKYFMFYDATVKVLKNFVSLIFLY